MSNNIASIMGLQRRSTVTPTSELVDSYRNVGVEIEVELVSQPRLRDELGSMWEVVDDGSLRPRGRCAELRFPTPGYAGEDIVRAIDLLQTSNQLAGARFEWRAAVHAHVDMRDKTPEDIHMVMVFYALLEPYIFAWEGKGRQESRFCMPWWVCSQDLIAAGDLAGSKGSGRAVQGAVNAFSKYTALNLAPLARLGTVEFRHMQSTRDKRRLLAYINICLDVVGITERVSDMRPIDLVLQFLTVGGKQFIETWMSELTADELLSTPYGVVPLTTAIQGRSVSAALSMAELHFSRQLTLPPSAASAELLNTLVTGE